VKRLEEEGVILGYKAILDPAKLGWETVASISINLVSKRYLDDVLQVIAGIEEVLFFSNIIGRHDIIAFAVCRDLQDLDALVNDLSKVPGVEGTPRTNIWVSVRNWADWSLPL
jgi:DNA-binding Lrp family transcriptional regulator